ncbi:MULTISPECIES: MgtC/SapB family protein [unclassified Sulfitobacter]|uniref:MgtC/SapB family protein n=1 Tax=unclassified Sulfitobacter TaxID=196795 RepID=UPI0007C3FB12|nr:MULTISPECIES: MgtC/SapB family protein [unclassified Sulfitobacter]KZX94589.1 MgtC/SapB transporter [Sulfitobacter sp. HI0023]KZY24602.1 MgtC/SapB transporter [Sulfitobacter sp. HI0040]KZZ66477.1 MgtC/SapB transporter [Sulfitobacter sp. HI0129]
MFDPLLEDFSSSFSRVPVTVAAVRLFIAAVLAGVVGIEREWRHKPAGLRTHILVAVAACLFIIIGLEMSTLAWGEADQLQFDPLRLIEAVTAGVAFLAAGIIFTSKGEVRNITTGASMWLAGAIGLACGAGQILLAVLATTVVVIVLTLLRQLERFLGTHD